MEELIPLINKIQEVLNKANIPNMISLPQIVVVGSQSSGKSSVLESLVGKDCLPRGARLVTRCPLRLQLVHTDTYDDYGVFSHIPECKFYDFQDICEEIKRYTNEICGEGSTISDKQIELKVYSSKVVDITLIDLPGMVKIAVEGNPGDIEHKIRRMVFSYIEKPNALILAISPANLDLANSDALNVAKAVDPDGERTIGVITKLDLLGPGEDAMDTLNGSLYPLKLGYIGVVCRSQQEIVSQVPMRESLKKEELFFSNHPVYSRISSRMGVVFLAKRLNYLLVNHIKNTLPSLKTSIDTHLASVEKELKSYGEYFETKEEKFSYLLEVIHKVSNAFNDFIDGNNYQGVVEELQGGARINYNFQSTFKQALQSIEPFCDLSGQDIRTAIMNATGPRGALFIPETAFEILVKRQIEKLRFPSIKCASDIYSELKQLVHKIHLPELQRFYNLKEAVEEVFGRVLRSCLEPTNAMINELVNVELSYINTHHPDFIGGSNALIAAQAQIEDRAYYIKTPVKEKAPEKPIGMLGFFAKSKSKDLPSQFEDFQSNGVAFPVTPATMKASENPSERELLETELIRILIENYFQIVKKNVGDYVPKAIMSFLVKKSQEVIRSQLVANLYSEEKLVWLFEESGEIAKKREKCKRVRKGLLKAREVLEEVRSFKLE